MKKAILKTVELLSGAEVYAAHTAIKGRKSSGKEDQGASMKNWKAMDGTHN